MADDRLWLCCKIDGQCALILKYAITGDSVVQASGVARFFDEHMAEHMPTVRDLDDHPFVIATDADVRLSRDSVTYEPRPRPDDYEFYTGEDI